MRKIVYTRPDGGTSIVCPVINTTGEVENFTEADAEQRAWDKLPVDAIDSKWINENDIPVDRTFRNAWKPDLTIDLDKAKEITKERLRREREPFLEEQDVLFMQAMETKADTTAIVAEKQRLRDITDLADLATTADALKAIVVS